MIYLDTSAVAKIFINEQHCDALIARLSHHAGRLLTSRITEVELARLFIRVGRNHNPAAGLHMFAIIDPTQTIIRHACVAPGQHLRALDAIHIATAQVSRADSFLTYDDRQADAAQEIGLTVEQPR